jgi:hypothetical protein
MDRWVLPQFVVLKQKLASGCYGSFVDFLPSIVSAEAYQHYTNLWDRTLGLELHIGLHRNDHVAFHKGALIPEANVIRMPQEMKNCDEQQCVRRKTQPFRLLLHTRLASRRTSRHEIPNRDFERGRGAMQPGLIATILT